MSNQITPAESGSFKAITDTTVQYFRLPNPSAGGTCIGGKIKCTASSSLLGKIAVTSDRVEKGSDATTWTNIETISSSGVSTAANVDISFSAQIDSLFLGSGITHIRFTPTSGTGTIFAVALEDATEITAARLRQQISSGISIGSNHAEDAASVSGDIGDAILGARNDTLATQTSADGDFGFPALDKRGRVMTGGAPRELKGRQNTTLTSTTSETTIVTAVASTFLDVYGIIIENTSATACEVVIRDSTGGTIVTNIEVPATDTRGFWGPVDAALNQTTVNNNWTAQCGTSVASIKIMVGYVKNV